jgi:uncharacterized damage-inducible protein DinB
MPINQSLLPEFDQEMAKTRETLARVPMEAFDWRPHEKSFAMGELANHIARLLGWGAETMRTEALDLEPPEGDLPAPPIARTTEDLLALFDKGSTHFRQALEEGTDEAFLAPWTLLKGGNPLFTLPRVAVIRNMILNHIIHHRGQLTVYLRMNDAPVPALYGPSADEAM